MRKTNILITLSAIVFVLLIIFLQFVFSNKVELNDSEKLQLTIDSFIACAAIISAIIVVWSYLNTNKVLILSKKPDLLVQALNINVPNYQHKWTRLSYRNTTNNTFEDLTFLLSVETSARKVSLDDLFRKNMHMPGSDLRERNFDPVDELNSRGFDLIQEVSSGNEVRFIIKYTFTYLGERNSVLAQEYKWSNRIKGWEIL